MSHPEVTQFSESAQESMRRDAAELLYKNGIAGILISILASWALVLGFENPALAGFQQTWLSLMTLVLIIRLGDAIYWRKQVAGSLFNGKQQTWRFITGTLVTAVFWAIYAVKMFGHVEIIELACMIIVISAMAGGSATVLAAHKATAMIYVFLLLVPMSVGMLVSGVEYQSILGGLGLSFSVVMTVASKKAADFTRQAIELKHQNLALVNHMEEQVAARTQEIYELSNIDPLTGLFNRSAFLSQIRQDLEHADKHHQMLALLFIDLDGFKKVNDSIGHATGDRVLVETAIRLRTALEQQQLLCRWGGDEFLVVLPHLNRSEVIHKAEEIIQRISMPYEVDGNRLAIGATIGVAFFPHHARTELELIQLADTAMYYQKKREPSKVGIFSDALGFKINRELKLKTRLTQALDNKELRLVYQPILESKSKKVLAFEALLRWQLDDEAIAPDEFIPLAEQYGMIKSIGAWVLQEACMATRRWQTLETRFANIGVSVNVSVIQMQAEGFVDLVSSALEQSSLAPECLFLEITESIFATDVDKLLQQVLALQNMGVKVSIDDFGTGYSSLSVMQDLAVNIVKIDRSFINKIDSKGGPIVNAVMDIADGLHFKVLAEGVETAEQMNTLTHMGVDFVQGYLLAKPMEENTIESYLKNRD